MITCTTAVPGSCLLGGIVGCSDRSGSGVPGAGVADIGVADAGVADIGVIPGYGDGL